MINIKHFAELIGKSAGVSTQQANDVIKETVIRIVQGVDDGEVMNVSGLGQFKQVIRKGRNCRHPITGKPMRWEDTPVVKFHPASRFTKTVRDEK